MGSSKHFPPLPAGRIRGTGFARYRNLGGGPLVVPGMTRLRGTLVAAAVPLLLLTACARPAGDRGAAGATGSREPESAAASVPGADDIVLRVESYGGFVPPDRVVGALPTVSVYGDGRVITDGPVPSIYPGPALPNLQAQTIGPEQVRALVREGVGAGVRPGTDFGRPNVADAPTTRVTVVTGYGPQVVTVEALNESRPDDPALTAAQREARARLAAYVGKLTGLAIAEAPVSYQPESVAVLARPWSDQGGDQLAARAQAWPGPALPGPLVNPAFGIGCVVVSGAEKDRIWAAAQRASAITPWIDRGAKWLITFRPLLPDEKDCAALRHDR